MGSERARERDGDGVALGRRVVLRFGVRVGCDDRVEDMVTYFPNWQCLFEIYLVRVVHYSLLKKAMFRRAAIFDLVMVQLIICLKRR